MSLTILRTAAGSSVSPFVIRALKAIKDVRVIAVDTQALSCGFELADKSYVVPSVSSPDFLRALLQICENEGVAFLFPDLDEELPLLAEARKDFEAVGTRVLVSSLQTIRECFDKYNTYRFFRDRRIPTPVTYLPQDLMTGAFPRFPLIVKPRSGRGSKDVVKVSNSDELQFFMKYVRDAVVQEFVGGVEYSVDTLSDLTGNFLYCSIRQRLATDSGISIKGRTIFHPTIAEYSKEIVSHLGIVGPGCLQCFENENGEVKFIEINPRIGGGVALSLAAGAPIISDIVRLMRNEQPEGLKEYRTDLVMLRYWESFFIESNR